MSEYAAFLRGINLGKARRVSSGDLRACFEKAGMRDVSTFRTSGNVAFDASGEPAGKLRERIEKELEAALGYEVTVFIRTAKEIGAIAAHEPFPGASGGKLQVAMLPGKPKASARKQVLELATDDDRLEFSGRELYWLPKGGMMETDLDLKLIEKLVGPTTRRTKNTVESLAAKYFGGG